MVKYSSLVWSTNYISHVFVEFKDIRQVYFLKIFKSLAAFWVKDREKSKSQERYTCTKVFWIKIFFFDKIIILTLYNHYT